MDKYTVFVLVFSAVLVAIAAVIYFMLYKQNLRKSIFRHVKEVSKKNGN